MAKTKILMTDRGRYQFTTGSGTTYHLELGDETSTLTRIPATEATDDHDVAILRKDHQPVTVYGFAPIVVGHWAYIMLKPLSDNGAHVTERRTTVVTSITEL